MLFFNRITKKTIFVFLLIYLWLKLSSRTYMTGGAIPWAGNINENNKRYTIKRKNILKKRITT